MKSRTKRKTKKASTARKIANFLFPPQFQRINGLTYYYYDRHIKKANALKWTANLHRRGYKTRIKLIGGRWHIYVHPNPPEIMLITQLW